MNKIYILLLSMFIVSSANAQPSSSPDKTQPVPYMQFLLSQPSSSDNYSLDCSNISDFINSYLEISETHQALLAVSAERLKREVLSNKKTEEEKEAVKEDIIKTLSLMEDSGMVLLNQSQLIKMTLPGCLK